MEYPRNDPACYLRRDCFFSICALTDSELTGNHFKMIIFSIVFNLLLPSPYATAESPRELKKKAEKEFNQKKQQIHKQQIISKKSPPTKVQITFEWKKKNFNLPTKVYELSDAMITRLREQHNTKDIRSDLLITQEVKNNISYIEGKDYKVYALAVTNNTNKPKWFYATPHSIEPITEGIGSKFICLCRGNIYRVKPQHTWYIVMMVRLYPANRSSWFKFSHNLIGVNESKVPKADKMNAL